MEVRLLWESRGEVTPDELRLRFTLRIASASCVSWFGGLERGGSSRELSSKQTEHGVGKPSVTMSGVGPCVSQ